MAHATEQEPARDDSRIFIREPRRAGMMATRILTGTAVMLFTLIPLLGLARLSYDTRYVPHMLLPKAADVTYHPVTGLLWHFGPIDWWAFLTPVALGVAAAAALRSRMTVAALAWILSAAVVQFLAIAAVFLPYFKVTSVMGYPVPAPYPLEPLVANLALVGTSLALATWSVARCLRNPVPPP